MYLAVTAIVVGQALALAQPGLLLYAAAVGAAMAAFATATRSQPCSASSAPSTRPTGEPCPPGGHATPGNPARPPNPPARNVIAVMGDLLDYAPIAAAAFAIPQFLPQLLKLQRTDDTVGVSWPWATLTSVNNAAWFAYFALSAYWAALVPASSATLLAGALAVMLARRGQARARPAVLIGAWVALLATAFAVAGRSGLGTLLTAAFVVQVTPSVWTAYRTARPSGISRGTWLLVLGELSCWTVFGVHKSDPRLMILGLTGVAASLLMLTRIRRTTEIQPSTAPWRASRSGPADRGQPQPRR
jgi:uncharacterized protein with PQ loop repeat